MSSLVLCVAASHTTLMNTHWNELKHLDRAERFRNALGQAKDALAAVCGYARGQVLAYEEIPEWLTGMAVVILDPVKEQERDG
jgi:hypothetical protein